VNEKIYNSVILGALLHDIGKLYQRINTSSQRTAHPKLGGEFVETFLRRWKNHEDFIDLDICRLVVQYHHERDISSTHWADEQKKLLAKLVSEADNLSSSQREREGEEKGNEREYQIFSVFGEDENNEDNFYDEAIGLDFYFAFVPNELEGKALRKTADDILRNEFAWVVNKKYDIKGTFWEVYASLYNLLLKTSMLIPDYTYHKAPKTSLFAHSSTTSAIAACLYQYGVEKGNLTIKTLADREEKRFLLFRGGFSPIQKFIFDISIENPKGLVKTLRGRSVLISLLSDLVGFSILYKLNLPISNMLQRTGGEFYLLLPNTDSTKNVIKEVTGELNDFIWKRLLGRLKFISAWVEMSGNDFGKGQYGTIADHLRRKFNRNKCRPHVPWADLDVISKEIYSQIAEKDFCEFCGVYWQEDNSPRCFMCSLAEKIGQKLPHKKFVCFVPGSRDSDFYLLDMGLQFVDSLQNKSVYVAYKYSFSETGNDTEVIGPFLYRPIANHLPTLDKTITIDHCKSLKCHIIKDHRCEILEQTTSKIMTFECMAVSDRWLDGEGNCYGDLLLGYLKGDVDNLGQFMDSVKENFTISEYLQFAYLLDYFFSGVLPNIIQDIQKYRKMYIVYAGGDDFFFLGPWSKMFSLAKDIRKWFREYTKNNSKLSLSMGLYFDKPKTPIKWAVSQTDRLLKLAKESGKDKLAVHLGGEDFILEWKDLWDENFVDKYTKVIASKEWSRGRINQLLLLRDMALRTFDRSAEIDDYLYASYLNYILMRDFKEKDKILSQELSYVLNKIKDTFVISSNDSRGILKKLGLELAMVLSKTRGC